MKGNSRIAEILTNDYNVKNLKPYEEIDYEISNFTDKISRVKITSKTGAMFFAPVYAFFDGYHMAWYGDYGEYLFDCTWETNVHNLAYGSPYYQLEKCRPVTSQSRFDGCKCKKQFIESITRGDWYAGDLSQEQKARFDEFIKDEYSYIFSDDILYEHEDICDALQQLYKATYDQLEWFAELRNTDFRDLENVFDCDEYALYDFGKKAPQNYFIILYMLSVVANSELNKQQEQNEETK